MDYNQIKLDDYLHLQNDIFYMLESALGREVAVQIMLSFDTKLQEYGNTDELYNFYYTVLKDYKTVLDELSVQVV